MTSFCSRLKKHVLYGKIEMQLHKGFAPFVMKYTYTYVLNTYIGTFFLLHARVMMNHVTCLLLFTYNFLSFPIGFYIPLILSNLSSNCSNVLDLRNLQEQVKKALCFKSCTDSRSEQFWKQITNFHCICFEEIVL